MVTLGMVILTIQDDSVIVSPWLEWSAIFIFHFIISMVYMIGYTAITTFGPSIEIIEALEDSPEGLSQEELPKMSFFNEPLSDIRIKNLIASKLIVEEHGYLNLTGRGRSIVDVVLLYRHLIGLPDGGGG